MDQPDDPKARQRRPSPSRSRPTLLDSQSDELVGGRWEGPRAGVLIDGAYRVVGPLGQGGMGTVLLALDERLQRDVAVKLIRPAFVASGSAHERFLVEARAMARVKHECVVEIYAFGEIDQSPYFVMEYIPGTNLANWLDDGIMAGTLPPIDESLNFLDQICRGVAAIHHSGAVHGDLKPSNILIGPASRIAIADMGLSRLFDTTGEASDHPMAGTPAYMAPEFARTDLSPELLHRSDVFALGVLGYEMLTGEPPWEIDSAADMVRVHAGEPPLPPSQRRPDLTEAFDKPLLEALRFDPKRRTPNAESLRKSLLSARETLTASHTNLRILVADDDADFRTLAEEALAYGFPGAQIEGVPDGQQALNACDREPAGLAVIDLDMPGMNGVELTAALRAHSDMPIVVVTASGGAPDWRLLQSLGATGFLVKPIDPYALITLSRKAIGMR